MPICMKISLLSVVLVASLAGSSGAQPLGSSPQLVGDVNGDRKVNGEDLKIIVDRWLDPNCLAPACEADLDGVPGVSMSDLAVLAGDWAQYRSQVTLVINEFMAENDRFIQDPNGDYQDWIEIYNYGDYTIDIGGMYLTDDVNDANQWYHIPDNCPEKTTIGPHSYLLVWADGELSEEGLHVDFGLDAGGEEDVGLFDTDGSTLIDSITDFPALGGDNSYGRFPNGNGPWCVFFHDTNTPPTPGETNGSEPGINVVINEIMYHPYHRLYNPYYEPEDIRAEYIELFNRGTQLLSLAGWRITDGVEFAFPNDVTIGAGQYLVVAADVNTFKAKYPDVTNVVGGWYGRLSNSGEAIELIDEIRVDVDRVRYADEGEWAVRELGPLDNRHRGWVWSDEHDGGGKSLELINPALPNEYGQNWATSLNNGGTPGVANSVADNDIAPMILEVKHRPIIPQSTDPVTVKARILDELTTGITVTLHYRVDTSVYVNENSFPHHDPGDYIDLTMLDDGVHGDGEAGDGIHGVNVPAQPDGTIIEFYIEASDAGANSRTWPACSDMSSIGTGIQQVTNLLYQVDDTYVPTAEWSAESDPIFYLIMTEMERGRLEDIGNEQSGDNGERHSRAQMNGTFISIDGVDMKKRYAVSIRNRGESTSGVPPNNYRVNFRHDDLWKEITAININSKYTYLQVAGSAIFCKAGLLAAEASPVEARVNGTNLALTDPSRMYGAYAYLEVFDGDWAENHIPDDDNGNIYKASHYPWTADLTYLGANPADYEAAGYYKLTNESENYWTDLFDLTNVLDNEPDVTYVEEVNRVLNVKQWLRWFAANAIIGNNETGLGTGVGDDYRMYRGLIDTRFQLLIHDLDTILYVGNDIPSTSRSIFYAADRGQLPVIDRFIKHPVFVREYYAQLMDLTKTVFAPEQFDPLIDQLLGDWVPLSMVNEIKQKMAERITYVLQEIPQDFSISSRLAQSYGYYETDVNVAALNGTADAIKTRSVQVNGEQADWSALDGAWSIGESTGDVIKVITLVAENATKKVLVPTGPVDLNWKSNPAFDDSGWDDGTPITPGKTGGVGYDENPDYKKYISYDVEAEMKGNNTTCYIRIPFTVDACDLADIDYLTLKIRYDDGFVAYINGKRVEGVYEPSPLLWNSKTAKNGSHEADDSFDEFPISDPNYISALQPGDNLLAIHGLNVSITSSDFLISAELEASSTAGHALDGIALNPGINRIFVQTFDEPNGTGNELERGFVDIWYNDGDDTDISGALASNTTLDAASGPWHVTGDIAVPVGVTLTIEPGTTLFFEGSTGITVQQGGRLVAEGTQYQRIRLTHVPGGSNWDGIKFDHSLEDNRLCFIDHEFGDGQGESTDVQYSRVLIDNMTWGGTNTRILNIDHPTVICRNSVFPSIGSTEPLHGVGLSGNEQLIFDGCIFGSATGYNDIIDFTGAQRPGPIFQLYNSIFLGGGDDGPDLDGTDAHIEGNIFMNFHHDPGSDSTSNAVATGQNGGRISSINVARNIFVNNDHAVLLKEDCFMRAQNNVFVDTNIAVISFGEPYRNPPREPGGGLDMEGNIFWNNVEMFEHFFQEPLPAYGPTGEVIINSSILPSQWHYLGQNNIDASPIFVDPKSDYHLKSMSPAIGLGAYGLDMGAYVPAGAAICGEPDQITYRTSITLTVGGPGITDYKYCINDPNGPWFGEFPVDTPIVLNGLTDGQSYTVYAIGKNSAGLWQSEDSASTSRTWTVDTSHWRLVISEVLARNVEAVDHNGTTPDLIELYYDGPASLDLADMSISDNPDKPRKFVFPAETIIDPGEYLVLYADDNPITPGIHLGFGLDGESEDIYLYDSLSAGGELLDSVEFGLQIPDLSIGRVGYEGRWTLTKPTFGQANIVQPLGDPAMLKINEWFTYSDMLTENNFIELYNPHAFPVNLGGLFLTDNPVTKPDKHQLAPLSFVPGVGMAVLIADGDPEDGLNHLNFRLSADQEIIALFDADLNEIDKVIYGPQTADVSQGRVPDGADTYAFCEPPTPGVSNIDTTVINEVLAHSHLADTDWIELYNTTDEPINIGGWFLSDNSGNRIKYEIADGTTIVPNGYIVFYEDVNFGNPSDPGCHIPFALSENGETVCLSSGLDGVLTGYIKMQEFGASQTGVSFGRYLTSTDRYDFVAMDYNTPDANNANPKVGPIVINEIMYNPASGNQNEEYIELHNTTGAYVTLYRTDKLTPWKFTDGIDYTFSGSTPYATIRPYGYLMVVKDLVSFITRYGSMPYDVGVLYDYDGWLSNDGEKVQIGMPGDMNSYGERQYICIDRVRYYDKAPWPTEADGLGKSLSRIDPNDYGNDVANWKAAAPSPGTANP